MSFEWYKRKPKKFLRGVVGMGPAVIGAYAVILDLIYEDEDSCPNDPHWIGGILGCSGRQTACLIRKLIELEKLQLNEEGRLVNGPASEELARRRVSKPGTGTPAEPPRKVARKTNESPAFVPSSADVPEGRNSKNKDLPHTDKTREDKNRIEKKDDGANAPLPVPSAPAPDGPLLPATSEEGTDLQRAVEGYNSAAARCPHRPNGFGNSGWSEARWPLTANRKKLIRARLAENGLDGWQGAMDRAAASDFLSGRARRQAGRERWGVDIGWIAKAENFTKLLEGKYDNDRGRKQAPTGRESAREGLMDFLNAPEAEVADG